MKLIAAFLKLVRLPNLLFLALTQVLFQYCIYNSYLQVPLQDNDGRQFTLIMIASIFIAAAGYIINDYFDINIDEINKPHRLVVDKLISRRWAIAWHFIMSSLGIVLTILALPILQKWYIVVANIGCVLLLWFYSTTFKKQLLIGNIIISLLTAWVILIIFFSKVSVADAFGMGTENYHRFFRIAFLYAGFAFIVTIIREAIKDMEDMQGDALHGCRTMPIVWGVNVTKTYTAVWLIVLLALLLILQIYVLQFKWWWVVAYSLLLLIIPLIRIFYKLFYATTIKDFKALSKMLKWVMLAGILSMLFFNFYQ